MPGTTERRFNRVLDPIDRVSEILFGLIMVLTATGTLSVLTDGRAEVRTMVIGALGCNLAWGIIDAGLYLMGCLEERGRSLLTLRAVQQARDPAKARQTIADALPPALSSVLKEEELEAMRARLVQLPPPQAKPRLTMEDWLGALAVCLLVFLSTFPVIIPFFFAETIQPALRVSNAIAIGMLFLCGYVFAQSTGLRPWPTGLVMVAIGVALTGVAVALGG
jgi:hypothetical protein